MIDWLYSKLAVLIASFLMLGSLVGLLGAVNGSLRGMQAETVAQRVAEVLDGMASTEGETATTISIATPGNRGTLPRTIAREPYFLQIYWDSVWVYREAQPDRPWRIAPLLHSVYTASPPIDGDFSAVNLTALEASARADGLRILPLRDIQVARVWGVAEGQPAYLTFVYAP